jgi:folate-binding protein YgfZ
MSDSTFPGSDYRAAFDGAVVRSQSGRHFLAVTGKAPGDMLNGLLSNSPPPPLSPVGEGRRDRGEDSHGPVGWARGSAVYSTLLTAKGRMITDLRIFSAPEGGFLMELPSVGFEGASAHFKKFLPPRLASVEDHSARFALLTLFGPESPALVASVLSGQGFEVSREEVTAVGEGEELVLLGSEGGAVRVVGNGDTPAPGWDLIVPSDLAGPVRSGLEDEGTVPLSDHAFQVLRIEKGRPVFGKDMDEETIPLEAGLQTRAIDNEKGCYTGQEVVIRIRDRGHVNKALRGLLLGQGPVAPPGQELFHPEREKSVGWITSSAISPLFGETVALGYIKRLVAPGGFVRIGSAEGPEARVVALNDQGWVLD